MTSISSIDTSFYPGLIEGFAPTTTQAVPAIQKEDPGENANAYYAGGGSGGENSDVDLSNYYSDIRPEDFLSQAGRNVAIQNGYGVNEACNIKMAEMAYKANAYVFNVASDISTFMLEV